MIIIYNNAALIKESSLSPCRAAEFCWNSQSVEAFRVGFSFSASLSTPAPLVGNTLTKAHLIPLPLTKCWFESLFREEPFDCINDKWESASDLSLVYRLMLPWWGFLPDNKPLEMNGQILPQDVPFDMRRLALMHTWWQWEWDLTRIIRFWRRLNCGDNHGSHLTADLFSCQLAGPLTNQTTDKMQSSWWKSSWVCNNVTRNKTISTCTLILNAYLGYPHLT